ncbi:MAG TPA: BTAD domain-containing putative transcriptional regulator [Longimicrobiales bacterium]|nr:BTAD domain-containing putative transcriptional regulator [Longimicrobiales bacterium]
MLEFLTLGRIDLKRRAQVGPSVGDDPQALLTQSKPTALFSYLTLARPRGLLRRDELATLFWPESSAQRARARLSQTLYVIRQTLGQEVLETRGTEEVAIARDAVWCDATAFRELIADGRPEDAMALYGGELLPAFFTSEAAGFERWLEEERTELARLAATTAWDVARIYEGDGNAAAAGHWGRRAASLAPFDEAAAQRLLELLARLGDRTGALREFERFRESLETELGIEPSRETLALVERIGAADRGPAREPGEIEPAGVRPAADAAPEDPVDPRRGAPPPGLRERTGRLLVWAASGLLVAAAALGARRLLDPGPQPAAGEARDLSLAVLPFVAGPAADSARAEQIGLQLNDALVGAGFVTPPYGVVREPWDSLPEALREAGIRMLVEGALSEDGTLTVRLRDPSADRVVWTRRFQQRDRPLGDFVLYVAQQSADTIGAHLGITPGRVRQPWLTDDPVADSLYHYGRFALRTNYTLQGARIAANAYAGAIERDSFYVPAYIGLAYARIHEARVFWDAEPRERMEEVARLLDRALELDPSHAPTHVALGWFAYTMTWDWEAAERHYLQAAELTGDDRVANYPFLLVATGRFDEGLDIVRSKTAANPFNPLQGTAYCWLLHFARRYEEAIAACRRVLDEIDPYYNLAELTIEKVEIFAVEGEGRVRKARSKGGETVARRGLDNEVGPAVYLAMGGDTAGALALVEREKRTPGVRPFRVANGYAWAGQLDSAFVWLDRAIEARDPYMAELAVRPEMEPYRADPRYLETLRRIGLEPVEW